MQYPSAYYLLLLYITVMCKPIIPLVQDVWAHAFYEQEHIATVHHQNGQNHVHYEVAKAANEDRNDDKSSKAKSFDDNISFHYAIINKLIFNNNKPLLVQIYFDRLNRLPVIFTAINLPPPKV